MNANVCDNRSSTKFYGSGKFKHQNLTRSLLEVLEVDQKITRSSLHLLKLDQKLIRSTRSGLEFPSSGLEVQKSGLEVDQKFIRSTRSGLEVPTSSGLEVNQKLTRSSLQLLELDQKFKKVDQKLTSQVIVVVMNFQSSARNFYSTSSPLLVPFLVYFIGLLDVDVSLLPPCLVGLRPTGMEKVAGDLSSILLHLIQGELFSKS